MLMSPIRQTMRKTVVARRGRGSAICANSPRLAYEQRNAAFPCTLQRPEGASPDGRESLLGSRVHCWYDN